jgi:hypothetical protein
MKQYGESSLLNDRQSFETIKSILPFIETELR